MIARELAWGAFADDPLQITMRVRGLDLTGSTFLYLVQENPFTDPLIAVTATETEGGDGVRIVATGENENGLYTDVEIIVSQATLTAALAEFPAHGRLTLYHKFQWTLPAGDGFSSVDKTVFYGPFRVAGGRNG